ncbi:MFS transporter [Microvirga terricola]|uniref:MHS family MFS transporter n=1 Tax=Microvirga terricola TaxID=2719797 RepID=A0ABX0VAA0_9HYPH|nr:MFS transporter [Microvirga terricola]NIX75935.1 MHS family MFS transporter [Microvirga terricola]
MLRFLQGVGLGGEATGSQLLAMEHAPDNRRGLYGALMAIGSPISQVLASLTLAGLAAVLSKEDFNEWGWRIPFLASFLLIGVGFYIRRSVEETPVFVKSQKVAAEKPRALAILQAHPKTLALLVMSWGASAAIFYICVTFAIYYLTGPLGLDRSISFSLLIVANGVSIFGGLLGGHLSDKIGRKKVLSIGLFLLLIATVLLFPVLGLKNWFASAAIISLALFAIQMNAGAQPAFFAESFPTNFRFTGSALGYTCSTMIFAAPAPFIATYLLGAFGGDPIGIVFYGLAIIAISAFALWRLPDQRGIPFE